MKLALVQPQLRFEQGQSNLARLEAVLSDVAPLLRSQDIVVLPEHHDGRLDPEPFERDMRWLAQSLGCHLVAGTQHQRDASGDVYNRGICLDGKGNIEGRYEKLRPYFAEQGRVRPGQSTEVLTIEGRRVLVMVCADFWYSEIFRYPRSAPDLVLVPALSVTRKANPAYSRALWQHLAVGRAYELGVYVGISDWAHSSELSDLNAAGVAGFADPTTTDPDRFFRPVGTQNVALFDLDFTALDAFHDDRRARGFFWR